MRFISCLLFILVFVASFAGYADYHEQTVNYGNDNIEIVLNNNSGQLVQNGKFLLSELEKIGFSRELSSDYTSCFIALSDSILPTIFVNEKKIDESLVDSPILIECAGKLRGVDIAKLRINPQIFHNNLTNSYNNEVKIRIRFSTEMKVTNPLTSGIPALFNVVLNKCHLPYILSSTLKNKEHRGSRDEILEEKKWYNPNINYLKISTHKDGIAMVSMASVIDNMPGLSGKDPKYLHLLLEAAEQAIYITDNDNKISDDDKIYFLGQRPYGDTSWINTYATYSPLYLYYDDKSPGKRLNLRTYEKSGEKYEGPVVYKNHTEDKTDYWVGSDIRLTETTENEGFYWKLLSQQGNQYFLTKLNLWPSLSDDDSINIALKIRTWDTIGLADPPYSLVPDYDLTFKINNNIVKNVVLNNRLTYQFNYNASGTGLVEGMNAVELISVPTDTFRLGITMIESIDIDARMKPMAYKGVSCFRRNNNSGGDIYLDIPGFSSSDIVVLDTNSNAIGFTNSVTNGLNYSNAVKSNYSSILINDSSGSTSQPGMSFGVLNTQDNSFEYLPTAQNVSDLSSRFDSAPNGSILSFIYNSPGEMPSDLKSYLNSIGASQASSHRSGDLYAVTIIKGTGTVDEQLSNKLINKRGFYEYPGGKSYLVEIGLGAGSDHDLIINDASTVEVSTPATVSRSDLWNDIYDADFLVISHKDFLTEAERFAKHRSSTTGYKYKILDIENIYKEFDYGIKSPHPIREYLKYIYQRSPNPPRYLVLMGDATWDVHKYLSYSRREDYIPSYGWPVSDYWYGLLDDDELPELIVGRLPVASLDEAKNVVDKIIYYDTVAAAPWMNNYTWLSGGYTESSREDWYENRFTYFFDFVTGPEYCADTASIAKPDPNSGTEVKAIEIKNLINAGTIWVTYLGHASAEILEMDGWQAERLNNFGRYSFLTTISCNSGDFSTSALNCRNESYVLQKDKGFIASIGSSTTTRVDIDRLTLYFIMTDFAENKERNIGDFLYYGKLRSHDKRLGAWAESALMTYQLIGDPMQRIRVDTVPDFFMTGSDIFVTDPNGGGELDESTDYAVVKCKLYNAGLMAGLPIDILVSSEFNGTKSTQRININDNCGDDVITFNIPIKDKPGRHYLTINVNPDSLAGELNFANNIIESSFEVFKTGIMPLDPLPSWNIRSVNPEMRFINPKASNGEYQYEFIISQNKDTSEIPLLVSEPEDIIQHENYISWHPKIYLDNDKSFWLRARLKDLSIGKSSSWLWISFNTISMDDSSKTRMTLINLDDLSRGDTDRTEFHLTSEGYAIGLNRDSLEFTAIGLYGIYGTEASRWVRITVDSVDWVDNPFKRGFNVLRVNKYNRASIYRRFDTFAQPDECTAFVDYMKDSVNTDEYCIMATCDATFLTPVRDLPPTHPGSIDSIKAVMLMYGSSLTESFCDTCSYAYSGYKYANPAEIKEMLNIYKDTAIVQGKILIYDSVGTYTSPVFGPAKNWIGAGLASVNTNKSNFSRQFYGLNKSKTDTTLLIESSTTDEISLSGIDALLYPYLVEKLIISDSSQGEGILIGKPYFEFRPLPELAFEGSKTFFENDSIMRGIPTIIHTSLQNISRRSDLDSGSVRFILSGTDGEILNQIDSTISLKSDDSYRFDYLINSSQLRNDNSAEFSASLPMELYEYNNKVTRLLQIYEDAINPSVEVFTDGRLLKNYDYVPQKPLFSLVFYDNSPLPFLPSSVRIKVNGRVVTPSVCTIYSLDIKEFGSEVKAKLDFQMTDPLDFTINESTPEPTGNLMEVYTSDASGNKDTLKLYLNVAQNGRIEDLYNYPNPTESSTTFTYIMKSPGSNSKAEITIFDAYGKKVRTLSQSALVGQNLLQWDGKGENNESLSTGAYYYRLLILSEDYFDPYFGSLMISR